MKKFMTKEELIMLHDLLTKYKEQHLKPIQLKYSDINTKNEALAQLQLAHHIHTIDDILDVMLYEF